MTETHFRCTKGESRGGGWVGSKVGLFGLVKYSRPKDR